MSPSPKYRHGGPVSEDDHDGSSDNPSATEALRDRLPVRGGLLVGVGAVVTSVLFAAIMAWTSRRTANPWTDFDSPPGLLTETAWLVLSNIGAEVEMGNDPGMISSYAGYQLLNLSATPLYTLGLLGAIVAAGYVVAECIETESRSERAVGALLVVPAYAVFAPALSVFATWSPSVEEGQMGPDVGEVSVSTVDAAIYAGILVPAALALLGGCLSVAHRAWLEHRQPASSATRE